MGNSGSTCRSEENVKTTKQKSNSKRKNSEKKSKQKSSDGEIEATPVEDVRTSDTLASSPFPSLTDLTELEPSNSEFPESRSVAATESAPSQSLSLSHAELTAKLTNRDFQDSIHSHRRQAVKSHRGVNKKAGGATTTDDGVIVAVAESLSSTHAADEFVEELLRPASVAGVVSLRASKPNEAAKTKTLHYGTKPGKQTNKQTEVPAEAELPGSSIKLENDVTFEDLEDYGDGDKTTATKMTTTTKMASLKSDAHHHPLGGATTELRAVGSKRNLSNTRSFTENHEQTEAASTTAMTDEAMPKSAASLSATPPRTVTFPLSVTSGGQSYILTTPDATAGPKGGRLPPIRKALPPHLQQQLRRRLPPLRAPRPTGGEDRVAVAPEDAAADGSTAAAENAAHVASFPASAAAVGAASGLTASKVEAKLAAASQRREANLGRRARASRKNQERGEEVRRRKEEKRKKGEEWRETLKQNADDRLRETKELFDELDF